MRYADWTFEGPEGGPVTGNALWMGNGGSAPLLVIPALFDEGNRMRRLTVEVMRRLAGAGITCVMPDLPGLQDSTFPLALADIELWRRAMAGLAIATKARRVLAMRGGALVSPDGLAGWHYAPVRGSSVLRQLIRARVVAAREAGREEKHDALMTLGRTEGLDLAGYQLGAAMVTELEQAQAPDDGISVIGHEMVGGAAMWLRAEPGDSATQADALAAVVAMGMLA